MMGKDGGTKIWCPHCKSVQICKVEDSLLSEFDKGGNVNCGHFSPDDGQVQEMFFKRNRECFNCSNAFITFEIAEDSDHLIIDKRSDDILEKLMTIEKDLNNLKEMLKHLIQ
jgi:hypothetical protein